MTSPNNLSLSADDIERMRLLVSQHDQTQTGVEFDLNKPPKQPYVFQAFPRVMYQHEQRKTKIAQSVEQMEAALEAGWSKEPFPSEPEERALDANAAAEAAHIDSQLQKRKK